MKKLLSLCLSALLVVGSAADITNFSSAASASINIGDYIQMGTYYNKPVLWRCVDIDENGPLMLSDKIICFKAFDADTSANTASGSHSINEQLRTYGSNYWGDSNIRSWLNSSASAGNVKWLCGNPPSADYVDYGEPYDQEAGFLTNFTQQEINAIKEVSQKSLLPMLEIDAGITAAAGTEAHTYKEGMPSEALQNYNTAYAEYITDKMFLLDLKQLNQAYGNQELLGTNYLAGKPTAECGVSSDDYYDYWLRTPTVSKYFGQDVRTVSDEVKVYSSCADNSFNGIRPAFYLDCSKATLSDGNGIDSRPYIITSSSTPTVTQPPEPDDPSGVFVKLGYVQGNPGDTVEMPLTLSNNTGFSNIALEVEYDSSVLTLVSVSENTGVGATFTSAQKITSNPYNMSWNSATSNNTFNGTLATLTFKISDSATSGNYSVGLSFYKGRNGDYIDGSSVNYDIDHVSLGLSYISGNVTAADSVPPEPSVTVPPEPDDPSGVFVKLGYVQGNPGDTVEMPLTLSNNTGFSNIALEVEYDSSVLTLVSVSENTGVGATFTSAQKITSNPYNMSWNSATSNNTFNGTLATLTFKISDSAASGNYPVGLSFYKGRNGDYIDGSSVNYDIDHVSLGLSYVNGNITASGYSEDEISPITAHYYDELDKIEVDAYLPEDKVDYEGFVIVSLYDSTGKLAAIQIDNASYYNHFEFYNMTSNHTAKVMWWNSSGNLRPLAKAKEIIPSI